MPTRVEGTNAASADRIRACTSAALTQLGAEDIELVVRVWGLPAWLQPAPDGIEASAGPAGIDLHRSVLGILQPPQRLCWILYEEVAHHVLGQAGVPHGGSGDVAAFFQEAFATWFQFDAFVTPGRVLLTDVRTTPVSPAQSWYELGKHVGAAVAGSDANRRHLADWLDRPSTDPFKERVVRWALELMVPPLTGAAVRILYERRPTGTG